MKTTLLLLTCLLTSLSALSQVVAGQEDTFEDGTRQSWTIGNPTLANILITLPADGGPDGAGDGYYRYETTGAANGGGSKCLIYSRNEQWSGDFISQGIIAIKMDVRAPIADLNLRLGFSEVDSFQFPITQIVTTNPVVVTAGSGWQEVTIPIQPSDFTVFEGSSGLTPAQVLASVTEMRIFSSPTVSWFGESGLRAMELDNIEASTTLSDNNDFDIKEFAISPNPATSKLNLSIPQNMGDVSVSIFDVLGKRVYSQNIGNLTSKSIDVSNWNTGVYLVRLFSDNGSQTKRFVKQ